MADVTVNDTTINVPPTRQPGVRRAGRVLSRMKPSTIVKDATIGGVAFVALRIVYIYLNALGKKPELLAGMGPKLIIDILAIVIVGVLLNRGLDVMSDLLSKFVSAFQGGIDRMAQSSEATAKSAQDGAVAQAQSAAAQVQAAAAQRDLAVSQQQQTAVMERVAAQGDRSMTEMQTIQTYQVNQGKLQARDLRRIGRGVEAITAAMKITTPPEKDDDND